MKGYSVVYVTWCTQQCFALLQQFVSIYNRLLYYSSFPVFLCHSLSLSFVHYSNCFVAPSVVRTSGNTMAEPKSSLNASLVIVWALIYKLFNCFRTQMTYIKMLPWFLLRLFWGVHVTPQQHAVYICMLLPFSCRANRIWSHIGSVELATGYHIPLHSTCCIMYWCCVELPIRLNCITWCEVSVSFLRSKALCRYGQI